MCLGVYAVWGRVHILSKKLNVLCLVLFYQEHISNTQFCLLCVNIVQRTLCFTKGGPVTVWAELYFGNVFETRSSRNKAQPSRPHPATCICVPLATDVFN